LTKNRKSLFELPAQRSAEVRNWAPNADCGGSVFGLAYIVV
jgi:hypothetical protein